MNQKEKPRIVQHNEISDILLGNKHLNFFATAVTPWNALSIDALLLFLTSQGIEINALIVIAEHYQAGYMIDETFFTNSCSKFVFLPYDKELNHQRFPFSPPRITPKKFYSSVFKNTPQQDQDLFYYSTFNHTIPEALIAYNLRPLERPICICYTEEGVGAYMGTFDKTYPTFYHIHSLGELRSFIRYKIFGRYVFRFFHKTFNSLIFKRTLYGLKVNKGIVPYYRNVITKQFLKLPLDNVSTLQEQSIIICTTAWRRNEILDNEDLRVLNEVCTHLAQNGYHLLLKTHPRDTYFATQEKYLRCELVTNTSLSLEVLCSQQKPLAIVSFSSTTLITSHIFWDIPVFCITDMLNRSKISSFYLDEIDSFKRTFYRHVIFISSPEDITDNLNNYKH